MYLKKIFQIFSKKNKETQNVVSELTLERIAMHEAAHGIVWYLFREKWAVNSLSIERNNLPDDRMNGALHISPNFKEEENTIERANEIFAIAFAGMVGQNIKLILQNDYIVIQIVQASHFNKILDTTGCSGDFEIASKYLASLAQEFGVSEFSFAKYKVLDLISLFQNHIAVQNLHFQLTQKLLEKGTLSNEELEQFFTQHNFKEYIEFENLDINFFHQR